MDFWRISGTKHGRTATVYLEGELEDAKQYANMNRVWGWEVTIDKQAPPSELDRGCPEWMVRNEPVQAPHPAEPDAPDFDDDPWNERAERRAGEI